MTIWKYPLAIVDQQSVMMPRNAKAISVADQDGVLTLWAIVDSSEEQEPRIVRIIGTGHPISGKVGRFLGSVVMAPFVWHVFVEQTLAEALTEML